MKHYVFLSVRVLERIRKMQKEKKLQDEMKKLRLDELKKKSKKGAVKESKQASRKKGSVESKQVCELMIQEPVFFQKQTFSLPRGGLKYTRKYSNQQACVQLDYLIKQLILEFVIMHCCAVRLKGKEKRRLWDGSLFQQLG